MLNIKKCRSVMRMFTHVIHFDIFSLSLEINACWHYAC